MAMPMQDAVSFDLTKDDVNKVCLSGSPLGLKAECIFNPKSPNVNQCWKSGRWITEKLIPSNSTSFDVVTIVGPLAHGKSHSLNSRIFRDTTSSLSPEKLTGAYQKPITQLVFDEQRAADGIGTTGVWAAYQNYEKFLVFDTQGFHEKPLFDVAERDPTSVSAVRNAVKLMALSDVVIFHTSTPRIDRNETFRFLKEASPIMEDRLRPALGRKTKPLLIVFHQVLQEHPLDCRNFRTLLGESVCSAFCDVQYLPVVRTTEEDFGALNATITQCRQILFSSDIEWMPFAIQDKTAIVPLELFACPYKCLACGKCCSLMQHSNGKPHCESNGGEHRCEKFVEALKNRSFICRRCNSEATVTGYSSDDYSVVKLFKYYTQGANTLDCPQCKTIYSSDEGVWPPDESCRTVETRVWHVWDAPHRSADGPTAIAPTVFYSRALLDPLVDATDSLFSIVKPKAQTVQKFLLDNVRPDYWVPDDSATQCKLCSVALPEPGDKHHCRQCGDIFCDSCSSHNQPVPERGWGEALVRVCNRCHGTRLTVDEESNANPAEPNVNGRWFFEQVGRVVSAAESVGGYIGGAIATQTMPDYWQKDSDPDANQCNCCHQPFDKTGSNMLQESSLMSSSAMANVSDKRRHHCRQCGKVVCGGCSPFRMAVPERGWGERNVRVCITCYTSKSSSTVEAARAPASSQ